MTEKEALDRMVSPNTLRPGKPRGGVIQIWLTRACDKSCFGCTQGSNLRGMPEFMTVSQFKEAVKSLKDYFGVVGIFGGNPAIHPAFEEICELLRKHIPDKDRRGLWCNNPLGKGKVMRETFNPAVSNLNVHLDQKAYDEFRRDWPECRPFGLHDDSRHSPPYVAIKDVLKKECLTCISRNKGLFLVAPGPCPICGSQYGDVGKVYDESLAWELISNCDINRHWSAMIGVFRGQLRAWFCEIAGAQSMLHQWDMEERGRDGAMSYIYPDTGLDPTKEYSCRGNSNRLSKWWELPMDSVGWMEADFSNQVRKHCHDCGVPLRGYGNLAQSKDTEGVEQVSETHKNIYLPKRKSRVVQLVVLREELGGRTLGRFTEYMQNGRLK